MKKLLISLLVLIACCLPVSAENSSLDFIEYSYSWLGNDPDALWRMTREELKDRLSRVSSFSCSSVFDPARGRSFYLCRSGGFRGTYRMAFYLSTAGLLEAVEFAASDGYLSELAASYGGQIPLPQSMLRDLGDRYGRRGVRSVENGIFTLEKGRILAHSGIAGNTYAVLGQNVREYAFDEDVLIFVFCSDLYAARHAGP